MADALTPDDREAAAAALDALNGGKVCRKCGADSEKTDARGYQLHPSTRNGETHGIAYNKSRDVLEVTCWRCSFSWTRTPDDRRALT